MTERWDTDCEYCRVYDARGVWVRCVPCGMTLEEHARMAKSRTEAEAQAHALVVAAREQELLPQAIIQELYSGADQDVQVLIEQFRRER
jgi:hypothetical protein